MKILKFGGTSVGSAERMKKVAGLVLGRGRGNVVVLSAMSGTTNSLFQIVDYYSKADSKGAKGIIESLQEQYAKHVDELYSDCKTKRKVTSLLKTVWEKLLGFSKVPYTAQVGRDIVACGEIMSSNMLTNYLVEQGKKAVLLSALDFMKTDSDNEPDMVYIKGKFLPLLEANKDADVIFTQGFICRDSQGNVSNLRRGGSDYTACILGAAATAEIIEIWTDIDGVHTGDPRFVKGTHHIHQLNFEEAAELSYFGAKILHPMCVLPAKFASVPIRLLSTMQPEAEGTIINNNLEYGGLKAVAAKDGIAVIKIVSGRMLFARGFMRKIFEIFEKYSTSVDMITTSEIGVSVSIDDQTYLNEIVDELNKFGNIEIDTNMCIVCVVGDVRASKTDVASKIVDALSDIPIRMISYGGSDHSISFAISAEDKKRALRVLNSKLF